MRNLFIGALIMLTFFSLSANTYLINALDKGRK